MAVDRDRADEAVAELRHDRRTGTVKRPPAQAKLPFGLPSETQPVREELTGWRRGQLGDHRLLAFVEQDLSPARSDEEMPGPRPLDEVVTTRPEEGRRALAELPTPELGPQLQRPAVEYYALPARVLDEDAGARRREVHV